MSDPSDQKAPYYHNLRPEMLKFVPTRANRILEIGCGAGFFRKNFSSNCEYWGIEMVSSVADEAATLLDHVLCGTFEEVESKLPDHYFDLIICNDVIEHMPDHEMFMQKIQQKMTDAGHIIGSVPNIAYWEIIRDILFKNEWEYADAGILDQTHLRFFTQKSLRRSLVKSGFTEVTVQGINKSYRRQRGFQGLIRYLALKFVIAIVGKQISFYQLGFTALRGPKRT